MDVTLYALSTCPYCKMTRKMLEDNDIVFDLVEADLLEGQERSDVLAEVKRLSDGTSFPVLVVDGEVVVGFNKKKIRELLSL